MSGGGIERAYAVDFISHAQLQMILQILADAAQILYDLDAKILQTRAVADS